jgi:hypothetical protein
MGSQARVSHEQQLHFIRAQISFNTPGAAAGVVVGHIPAGARIRPVESWVVTAFNAGTANPIHVGTIPEANGVPTAAPAAQSNLAAGIAGQTAGAAVAAAPSGQNGVAATDLALVVSYVPSGTAATAGVADVVVSYYPNV